MKHALALAAALVAGSAHAQEWTQFISAPKYSAASLSAQGGLTDDASGRIVVDVRIDPQFSSRSAVPRAELHMFDAAGTHLAKPGIFQPSGLAPLKLTQRGTSARNGARAAWYEVDATTTIDDVIVAYAHGSNEGSVLRLRRVGGSHVVHVSSDGAGGAIVVRKPGGWSFPVVERMKPESRGWRTLWSTQAGATGGACGPGTRDVLVDDAHIEFDRSSFMAWVHVLARCDGGAVQPDTQFIQSVEIADGAVHGTRTFREQDVGGSEAVRHALGQGAWLYESKDPSGYTSLVVADLHAGIHGVPWSSISGPVHVERLADGGLIGAHLPDHGNAYNLWRIRRSSGYFQVYNGRMYPSLSTLTGRTLHWSEDAQQHRVVAWRDGDATSPRVHLRGYTASGTEAWQRTIEDAVDGAEPQLRLEPLSGAMVLAVDVQVPGKPAGVHVEGFDPSGQVK